MTLDELIAVVAVAVPEKDKANALIISRGAVNLAIRKVSRTSGVDFNREMVTFNFTAGKDSYDLGKDIIQKYPQIRNIQDIYIKDIIGGQVQLMDIDEFMNTRGTVLISGVPRVATIHSASATLQVYPIPSANYEATGYIQLKIDQLSGFPDYEDIIYAQAINILNAASNAQVADKLATAAMQDVQTDSQQYWDGTIIMVDRALDDEGRTVRSASNNLLGN